MACIADLKGDDLKCSSFRPRKVPPTSSSSSTVCNGPALSRSLSLCLKDIGEGVSCENSSRGAVNPCHAADTLKHGFMLLLCGSLDVTWAADSNEQKEL